MEYLAVMAFSIIEISVIYGILSCRKNCSSYGLFCVYGKKNNIRTASCCLLLASIQNVSLPLKDPRKQGIGIFSSSQMSCLRDSSCLLEPNVATPLNSDVY